MLRPAKDLTGQRFGKLVVLKRLPKGYRNRKNRYWLCRCDCGTEKAIEASNLLNGSTKSCGCAKRRAERPGQPKSKSKPKPNTRYSASICWECIRSAAPPEVQCIWDKTRGKVLPKGATYEEYNSTLGHLKRVLTCPEFEQMDLSGRILD